MSTRKPIIVPGLPTRRVRVVWGREASGRYLGEEFFLSKYSEDQRSKFVAAFEIMEELGFARNSKILRYPFKGVSNVGEFKAFQKRLFLYRVEGDLVITHGATKKTEKTNPEDIKRVERIKKEIEEQERSQGPRPPTDMLRRK